MAEPQHKTSWWKLAMRTRKDENTKNEVLVKPSTDKIVVERDEILKVWNSKSGLSDEFTKSVEKADADWDKHEYL